MNKRFLVKAIHALLLCGLCVSVAQSQTLVTITDTLKNADGTNAAGRLLISWDPFTAASGETIDGGTIIYTITSGVVGISLAPNIGATPAGTSYRAQYYLTNRASYRETWVIPATGPVTIAAIRVSIVPSPTVTFNAATQLTGIVPIANGGTGLSALGSADLCLKVNSGGTALEYGSCASGGTGITSLNGLTAAAQTFANDTNVTISSATSTHTLGWTGLLALSRGGSGADLSGTGGANQFLKQSTLGGAVTVGTIADADVPDSITVTLAATATALAANGGNCSGNNFALGVDASGVGECAQPAFSNLSGSATDAQIPDTITASNYLPLAGGTMTGELALAASGAALSGGGLVDCDTAGTSKLLWDATTARFSCGTDQTGGGSAHDILSATHTDSTAAAVSRGSVIVGQTATPKWQELVIGAANTVLGSDGTDATWTSLTDAHVPDTITLTNITQITNRAISDTTGTLLVPRGGSGATTLTGLLQGNGTSAFTAITDSSTVGQVLRVTGASAYGWGALDLADGDALTGLLPDGNITASITRDSEWPSATATLTNKDIDGDDNDLKLRVHATDCAGLTDGKDGEPCYEQDADTLYVCEPTAGDCDTAAEWRLVSGASDGVGYDEVLDEASGLTKRAQLNFIGAGVSCVDNAGATRTDCTISSSGDSEKTHLIQAICDTPDTVTDPGETFVQAVNFAPVQANVWQFRSDATDDPDGAIFCHLRVPNNLGATPAAAIVLSLAANNTTAAKDVRLQVSTVAIADTESFDAAFVDETAFTVLMPTVAYEREEKVQTLTNQPVADDILWIKIFRDGNHADDDLDATNLLLIDVALRIDLTL